MEIIPGSSHVHKPVSRQRKQLYVITLEGIAGVSLYFLLAGPFQTSYLLFLGASPLQIGIAAAIPFLANVLQVAAAIFMQRIENRKLYLIVSGGYHRVAWVLCGFIPLFAPGGDGPQIYLAIYATAFMVNAFTSVIWTSLVADIVPAKVRGRFFGIRNMVLWGAASVHLWVFGQVFKHHSGYDGFRILFVYSAVLAVIDIALWFAYANPPFEKSLEAGTGRMLQKPLRDRAFLRAALFVALWMFLMNITVPMWNYVMLSVLQLPNETVSAMTIVQNVVMMASYYVWGKLTARYSVRKLLQWSLPFIAAACVIWGAARMLPITAVVMAAFALLGVGIGGFNLMVFNFTIGDTPKSERPMYIAIFSAMTGLAGFCGPIVGGFLYKKLSHAPLWLQSYGLTFGAGLVLLLTALTLGPLALKERRPESVETEGDSQ